MRGYKREGEGGDGGDCRGEGAHRGGLCGDAAGGGRHAEEERGVQGEGSMFLRGDTSDQVPRIRLELILDSKGMKSPWLISA